MKPLLFLDIDGVINVDVEPYDEYVVEVPTELIARNPFTWRGEGKTVTFSVCIPKDYTAWLGELSDAFEIVWASTWEKLADIHIGPLVGMVGLNCVALSETPMEFRWVKNGDVGSWKWAGVRLYAGERPFVLVDDQVENLSLAHSIDSTSTQAALQVRGGLRRSDVDDLLDFAVRNTSS